MHRNFRTPGRPATTSRPLPLAISPLSPEAVMRPLISPEAHDENKSSDLSECSDRSYHSLRSYKAPISSFHNVKAALESSRLAMTNQSHIVTARHSSPVHEPSSISTTKKLIESKIIKKNKPVDATKPMNVQHQLVSMLPSPMRTSCLLQSESSKSRTKLFQSAKPVNSTDLRTPNALANPRAASKRSLEEQNDQRKPAKKLRRVSTTPGVVEGLDSTSGCGARHTRTGIDQTVLERLIEISTKLVSRLAVGELGLQRAGDA